MTEVALNKENNKQEFKLKGFFDTLNSIGNIPISLGEWEMTGNDSAISDIVKNYEPLIIDTN